MLHVVGHPLAADILAALRDADTGHAEFRRLSYRLTTILALEATRDLPTAEATVRTPLEEAGCRRLEGPIAAVPILRAGLSMLEAVTDLFPEVAVGYIGLERDERTALASSYYCKLPKLEGRFTLLLDPMLATGGSAIQAAAAVTGAGASPVRLLCAVAAPEGVHALGEAHPEVDVFAAALDRELDGSKYILPGLGDYGDRLFGTP